MKDERTSTVYHAPLEEQSVIGYYVGLLSRMLLTALGGISFLLLWVDAFRFENFSVTLLVFFALAISLFMSITSSYAKAYHKVPFIVYSVLLVLPMFWLTPLYPIDAFTTLWNSGMGNLKAVSASYGYLASLKIPYLHSVSSSEDTLVTLSILLLCLIVTSLLSRCILYGVRILPLGLISFFMLFPVFLLNIVKTNYASALLFAFFTGVITLWVGDRRFLGFLEKRRKKKEEKLKKRLEKQRHKEEEKKKKQSRVRRIANAYFAAYDQTKSLKKAREARRREKKLIRFEDKMAAFTEKYPGVTYADTKYSFCDFWKNLFLRSSSEQKKKRRSEKISYSIAKKQAILSKREAKKLEVKQRKEAQKAKKEQDKENREDNLFYNRHLVSCTGYAGCLAALVAFIIGMFVAFQTQDRFPIIDEIYDPVSVINDEITAIVTGGDIDLNELAKHMNVYDLRDRQVTLDPRSHSSERFLTVFASSSLPLYLRQWTSGVYDTQEDAWKGVSTQTVDEYRERFGSSFSPDILRTNLYSLFYEPALTPAGYGTGRSYYESGFATEFVSVMRTDEESYLLYVPSALGKGLLEVDSLEKNGKKFTHYFDGIYSSRNFRKSGEYGTYSYVTTFKYGSTAGDNIAMNRASYEALMQCILAFETLKTQVTDDRTLVGKEVKVPLLNAICIINKNEEGAFDFSPFLTIAYQYLDDLGLNKRPHYVLEQYVYRWTEKERSELLQKYGLEMDYRDYVYDVSHGYLSTFGSSAISSLASKILLENGLSKEEKTDLYKTFSSVDEIKAYVLKKNNDHKEYSLTHSVFYLSDGSLATEYDVVMTVINYLADNYTYELVPHVNDVEITYDTVTEQFLFNLKEGYCTHFATAAVALLREMGIPARYVEGALVTSFYINNTDITSLRYKGYVAEKNLHAWIEVYIDGLGWQMFEATPTYYLNMYPQRTEKQERQTATHTTALDESSAFEETDGEDEEEIVQSVFPKEVVIALSILLVVGGCVIIFISHLRRRARQMLGKRNAFIERALRSVPFELPNDDIRELTRELSRDIMRILVAIGCGPRRGELSEEYGKRLEESFGQLSTVSPAQVMRSIQKEEFGHGVSYEELCQMALYLRHLTKNAYQALTRLERIKIRYFKRIL